MNLSVTNAGKTLHGVTADQARVAGFPEASINIALVDARRKAVNVECRRRIYAIASAETQLNLTAATARIAATAHEDRTADDLLTLAGASAAIGWVETMRRQVSLLAEDPGAVFRDDAAWPDLPAEAQAAIDHF